MTIPPPLCCYLQAGALDLLKELRSVPMTLELLQVSLLIFVLGPYCGHRHRSNPETLTHCLLTVHQDRDVRQCHTQTKYRRGGYIPSQVLDQVVEEAFG